MNKALKEVRKKFEWIFTYRVEAEDARKEEEDEGFAACGAHCAAIVSIVRIIDEIG